MLCHEGEVTVEGSGCSNNLWNLAHFTVVAQLDKWGVSGLGVTKWLYSASYKCSRKFSQCHTADTGSDNELLQAVSTSREFGNKATAAAHRDANVGARAHLTLLAALTTFILSTMMQCPSLHAIFQNFIEVSCISSQHCENLVLTFLMQTVFDHKSSNSDVCGASHRVV